MMMGGGVKKSGSHDGTYFFKLNSPELFLLSVGCGCPTIVSLNHNINSLQLQESNIMTLKKGELPGRVPLVSCVFSL